MRPPLPHARRRHRLAAGLAALLALAGCAGTPPDAHVPPFAKKPYEPFSRAAAVAIALAEWRAFGSRVEAAGATPPGKAERAEGLWQRIGEYWWLGQDAGSPESGWTGKHDADGAVFPPEQDGDYAWSAAFVSYVMRMAGAGPRFPYSSAHATYINRARAATLGQGGTVLWAERPALYAPRPGDLICFARAGRERMRFDDLPARRFPSHCEIVVGTAPGRLDAVGGNVADAVTLSHVPATPDGRIAGDDGTPLDKDHPWFVVIRILYDDGPAAPAS
ncbi:MAG: DUF2272 domain-containing protein [Dongiaceae bacterium]